MLDIPATGTLPVQFDGKAYIRVGSATPPLRKFPQREEALMAKLRPSVWEEGVARAFVTAEQVLRLLDHGSCLSLLACRFWAIHRPWSRPASSTAWRRTG